MTTPDTFMQATLELARLAGDVALTHFRTSANIQTKNDGCPVTKAEGATEAAALPWLASRWPKDGIVSEESGLRQPESRCCMSVAITCARVSPDEVI